MRIVVSASRKDAANRPGLTLSEAMVGVRTNAVLFVAIGLLLGLAPSAVAVPFEVGAATDAALSGGTVTDSDGLAPSRAMDRYTETDRANFNGQVIGAPHGDLVQDHSIPPKKDAQLQVPDGGNTAVMLGIALVCLSRLRAKFKF